MASIQSVTLNPTFARLNDDRNFKLKENSSSREREAMVDIKLMAGGNLRDGATVDFSKIYGFKRVYACVAVAHKGGTLEDSLTAHIHYEPSDTFDASTGKIRQIGGTPSQLDGMTITVLIRGN